MKIVRIVMIVITAFIFLKILMYGILPWLDDKISVLTHQQIPIKKLINTKENCLINGGDWEKVGYVPKETCLIRMKDSGNQCIAGFQCEAGVCLTKFNFNDNFPFAIGVCPNYARIFGCSQKLHFGIKDMAICVD